MLKGIALLVLAVAPLTLASDTYTKTVSQSWDFEQGGSVELHMPAGDLRVVPGNDSSISISYTMRSHHPDFVGKVKLAFEVVKSSAAVLRLEAPHNGSVDIRQNQGLDRELPQVRGSGQIPSPCPHVCR